MLGARETGRVGGRAEQLGLLRPISHGCTSCGVRPSQHQPPACRPCLFCHLYLTDFQFLSELFWLPKASVTPAHPPPGPPGPQLGCCPVSTQHRERRARLHATAPSSATGVSGTDKALPSRSRTAGPHLQAGETASRSHEPTIPTYREGQAGSGWQVCGH